MGSSHDRSRTNTKGKSSSNSKSAKVAPQEKYKTPAFFQDVSLIAQKVFSLHTLSVTWYILRIVP